MPSLRRLMARKWMPALLYGRIAGDDIGVDSLEPGHFDRAYLESEFGSDANGVLQKILRLWVQGGRVFGESTADF